MDISGMSISGSAKPVSMQRRASGGSARSRRAAYGRKASAGSSTGSAGAGGGVGGGSVFAAAGRSAVTAASNARPQPHPSRRGSGDRRAGGGPRAAMGAPRSMMGGPRAMGMPRAHSAVGHRRSTGRTAGSSAAAAPGGSGAGASRYKLAPGAAEQIAVQQRLQMERSMRQQQQQQLQQQGRGSGGPESDDVGAAGRKPTGVSRAKTWTPEVENAFRMQEMGWRDVEEYRVQYGEPETWDNGFYSKLQAKKTGYYTYWSESRECLDKYLHRVKLFTYGPRRRK